ncbi:tetratricopeptide repeat protein [Kribbella shirazensis]|uniref:Tetratricopeptide (TPR) repeat protein n=1 Tax=Kribbella shirazensis TaxID=1105143 RepID=A0A7X5V872_9ACTN|nr:tetratricopeptide repeat protein [Kribbella shirazensis]NIK56174.1 tetratricopeptide (TPR) repeat protein [Kribbella shirazensis]
MSDKREEDQQTGLTRDISLAAGAVATGLLTDLTSQLLGETYGKSGLVKWVGFGVTFLLLVVLALQLVSRYRRARRRKQRETSELHAAAEEAEQWMIAFGSGSGGMAAAEWFTLNEDWLRSLVATEKPTTESLDDFARICDALEVWYVRRPDADALLQLSDLLSAAAEACGSRGLAELAAARAATAYRMLGDLDTASTRLGISDNIATNGRTAAALKMRRQVERALLHLATAERAPAGNDREEAVLNARDRLDDARLLRPGPDLAADVAISVNLAVVQLYQHDAEGALEHLRPAHARAKAAGDVSGEAHALELIGVAAWMQRNPHEAISRWKHAAHLYAEIDEREGHARCLQHLGSAHVVDGDLDAALELLEQSALLRTSESEILTRYLDAARKTSEPPVVDDDPPRRTPVTWLKRAFRRFVGGLK